MTGGLCMNPQQAKYLFFVLGAAGFVCILLVVVHPLFLAAGLLMAAAAIVLNLMFYRCPCCRAHLGRTSGNHCPHCGHFVEH